jgi:hypothetical protein
MNETITLLPGFQIIGIISIAASSLALGCSLGHTWFYFAQRKVQTDSFMRGLACRMKALFAVMALMFTLDLITGFGLTVNYTMGTWYAVCAAKSVVSILYVAALFWLYFFYRKPH